MVVGITGATAVHLLGLVETRNNGKTRIFLSVDNIGGAGAVSSRGEPTLVSQPVMAQTNLLIKVLLCLLVPAYQALQQAQTAGSTSSFSFLRYWLVLSSLFLSELFLDQLNLSPMFFLLKLAFMLWFVAPVEYNGSHLLHEQVGR